MGILNVCRKNLIFGGIILTFQKLKNTDFRRIYFMPFSIKIRYRFYWES